MGNHTFNDLNNKLAILQNELTELDSKELASYRRHKHSMEFLVSKNNQLVIRMDANKNHKRPHIHIDYGEKRHIASYAIDSGELLAGKKIYKKEILKWISENKKLLMEVWKITRTSAQPKEVIAQLKASKVWV